MKRLLLLLSIALMLCSFGWGEAIPTFFNLGANYPGSVNVASTSSGSLTVCTTPTLTCTPVYRFEVATAPGTLVTQTTTDGGMTDTIQTVSYGSGGTINITVNGTFFLSGTLLSAYGRSRTLSWGTPTPEEWERELSGTFMALVLNPDYWGSTEPGGVGGSFSVLTAHPHSPMWTGSGHLAVTPVPEPGTLILLTSGVIVGWRRWRAGIL